jgi:hypothetical protein
MVTCVTTGMQALVTSVPPTTMAPTGLPTNTPTNTPLKLYFGKFAFLLILDATVMEVVSAMNQADVNAALAKSLLSVFVSPMIAIIDISVTPIRRRSVVEYKVVVAYSLAIRLSYSNVQIIAENLDKLFIPDDALTKLFARVLGRNLANVFLMSGSPMVSITTTMSESSPHVQEEVASATAQDNQIPFLIFAVLGTIIAMAFMCALLRCVADSMRCWRRGPECFAARSSCNA